MPLKPMLAKDADLTKLAFPLIVQPKLDGIRVHVQDGVALTRTLKRVPNAEVQAALGCPEFEGFDGEIIVGSPTAEDVYRQTTSFVMSESKTRASWTFYVFDMIDRPGESYTERRDELVRRVVSHPEGCQAGCLRVVASMLADSAEQLERMEALLVDQGYEGVILRDPSSAYKHGRSTPTGPLLKLKRFVDFEAVVLDVYEENHNANVGFTNELGRTARSTAKDGLVGKDRLGGFVVSPVDDSVVDHTTIFRVGTGFDHAQREDYWREWHENLRVEPVMRSFIQPGAVCKVKSFPVGVKDKPRHPVFLGWRDLGLDG